MANEITKLAQKEIERRRQNAIFDAGMKKEQVSKLLPRVKELTLQMSTVSSKLSKIVFARDIDTKSEIEKIMYENLQVQRELELTLTTNGFSKDYIDVKYTCLVCEDSGFVDGIRCECFNKLVTELSIKGFNSESNIKGDMSFNNFSLDFYDDTASEGGVSDKKIMANIFNNCKEYAGNFSKSSKSILMLGATGLGKTHLSLSIANVVMKNGFSTLYASAPDLFRKLQNEYYGKGVLGADTMESLQRASLVIIDDLGAEIENQFALSALYNIVNTRLNCGLPTIISTNLSLKDIEKRYTDRVASRVMTMYSCLKFVGKDVRMQKLTK